MRMPFYDPDKTFEENYAHGPFGAFADGKVYEEIGEPLHTFFDQKVYLPFGIGAGPLYNGRFLKGALDKGFDIVTHKTVRSATFPCNPFPNILGLVHLKGNLTIDDAQKGVIATNQYKEPLNIINSFNNPSFEASVWQNDLRDVLSYLRKGQVLVCSYEALPNPDPESFIADWVKCAKLIKETGVKFIELNTSCPNAGKTSLLCLDTQQMEIIAKKVKKAVGDSKVIIKLSYFQDNDLLEDLVVKIGHTIDGFAAINTVQAKIYNEQHEPILMDGPRKGMAGVSGDSIRWLGLDMIKRLDKLRTKHKMKFKIIGLGGVANASHYTIYKNAGADTVMSVTASLWNPYLAQEIKSSILHGQ